MTDSVPRSIIHPTTGQKLMAKPRKNAAAVDAIEPEAVEAEVEEERDESGAVPVETAEELGALNAEAVSYNRAKQDAIEQAVSW